MKIAIIDVGSNSVRIGIFASGKIVFRDKINCQLAEGMAFDGLLKKEAIKRSFSAVKKFVETAIVFGVERENIHCFATASVRNSANGNEFVEMVKNGVNQPIAVLSGEQEAEIALLGVFLGNDGNVVDVGGGSTELIRAKKGKITFSKSLKIGAVVLTDLYGEDREKLSNEIEKSLDQLGDLQINDLTVIGGTCSVCAMVLLKLSSDQYQRDKVHGFVVEKQKLISAVDELFNLGYEGRVEKLGINPKRAKIICAGALILLGVMNKFNLDKVIVSENDNIEGYFAYLGGKRYER